MYERYILEQRRQWKYAMFQVAVVAPLIILCFSYVGLLNRHRVLEGIPSILSLFWESMPPRFAEAQSWLKPLLDTVAMSVAGTAIAVALSLPLGLMAARNTTPHPAAYHAARAVLNGLRSVPELIMGIVFVAAVGFGALPGVLALGLHSVGMVGKFFAEAIEHAAREPIEAVEAAGASPVQVIFHGVIPQVLPMMADVSVYRWEYNFRASTVMGMVGAGGIGFELMSSLRLMQYRDVSALLIVILITVTLVDSFGSALRKRFK
jgi:phosphonate transport system permease protein